MVYNNSLSEALTLLGLNSKENRFYLSALELGASTVDQIISRAKLKRATGYLIVRSLMEKGLIEQDLKNYRRLVYASSPKTVLRLISFKQRQFRRKEIELEERLPELESTYGESRIRPKVRVYEGRNGLIRVWKDILEIKQEVLLWTNQETERKVFSAQDHQTFINQRVNNEITIRVLAVFNKQGELLQKGDREVKRETKLLPKWMDFSTETYIYGNKVASLDYQRDIIGVIIESVPIAESQKAIFEMVWKGI